MIAAVCEKERSIVVKDIGMPEPGAGEVLIKVKAAGICGSDVRAYLGVHPEVVYPVVLGHELSGEIAAMGKDVEGFKIDDAVIVEPVFPCGECSVCSSGDYNLCDEMAMIGYQISGAFAEYTIARSAFIYPKDESLSFEEAALIEPLAAAVHAVKRAGVGIGNVVAILGAGGIGMLTMQVAKKAGATVVIADISIDKLHMAADMGADYVVNPEMNDTEELVMALTKERGADVVIDCVGMPETLAETVELARSGGTIVLVGWTGNETDQISLTDITMKEINMLGSSAYCRDFPTAIDLVVSKNVNLKALISHEYSLSEVGQALEELSKFGHDIVKAVVRFSEKED